MGRKGREVTSAPVENGLETAKISVTVQEANDSFLFILKMEVRPIALAKNFLCMEVERRLLF